MDYVEYSICEANAITERAIVVLQAATREVFKVSGLSKENPTKEEAIVCNQACRVDLNEARLMLEAVESMLEDVKRQTGHAQIGLAGSRKGGAA